MKKNNIINALKERTNRLENECNIIYDILEKHSIIGRKNKEKMKNDFMEELNVSEKEADEIYNISMELIMKDFFKSSR